jgi:hypothetical protein
MKTCILNIKKKKRKQNLLKKQGNKEISRTKTYREKEQCTYINMGLAARRNENDKLCDLCSKCNSKPQDLGQFGYNHRGNFSTIN